MNSSSSLREPRSTPLALNVTQRAVGGNSLLADQGVGRGRGHLFTGKDDIRPGQNKPVQSTQAVQKVQQLQNVNQPLTEYERKKQILDNYIPGLHRPGENYPELPTLKPKRPNPIPESLISDYHSGRKNAIMVIHEYGSILKKTVDFFEVAAKSRNSFAATFACECKVGGKTYPQGVGKTKKDAKKEAAKNAFDAILLSHEDSDEDENAVDEAEGLHTGADTAPVTDSSVDIHGLGHKNPVMMLYEYCAKKNWKVSVTIDEKPRDDGFHCIFTVNNKAVSEGIALNKKDAKTKAGNEALRKLLNQDYHVSHTHWDQIAKLVHDCAERLIATQFPNYGWNVLAGFVVKRNQDHAGEVVALGTGDACFTTQNLKAYCTDQLCSTAQKLTLAEQCGVVSGTNSKQRAVTDGMVMFDCHAEVIARRALLKWFYQQIHLLYGSETENQSIFEWNPKTCKVRLKESVSIHMYISTAPCGDAAAFDFEESTVIRTDERDVIERGIHLPAFDEAHSYGRLRVKCDIGLTSVPIDRVEKRPTFEELISGDQNIRNMSCSSKLLKWNVLGLQGSLLSQFVEPIYLSSLTLGSKFHLGHLVRAICCRLPDSINEKLPAGFSLRHPYVGRVSVYVPAAEGADGNTKHLSINWCHDDRLLEVVDPLAGLSLPISPFRTNAGPDGRASRLCKHGFHFRFKQLCEKTQNLQLLDGFPTYIDKKAAAAEYNAAKAQVVKQLQSDNFGCWMSKPDEFEKFH